MSSEVNAFASAHTNLSQLSLCNDSSARMTIYTSCSDYETPTMTTRDDEEEDDDVKSDRTEVPDRPTTDYNKFVICSQSSTTLHAGKTQVDNKFAIAIKSESFITQQSQAINDFMEDIYKTQEHQGEPNLVVSHEDSAIESEPTTEDIKLTGDSDSSYLELIKATQRYPSLTETKHKIMENLSEMTIDKLFSKYRTTSNENCMATKIQSKLFSNPSFQSHRSRRSRRSMSIDSILRIDYELQPLNLMLSKLLAEFKAMELKSKIDLMEADSVHSWCYAKPVRTVAVGSNCAISPNTDFQEYLKYKEERQTFLDFLKRRDELDVVQIENFTQTPRYCSGDFYSPRSRKDEYTGKSQSARSRYRKRHHIRHSRRKSPPMTCRSTIRGESIGREILEEITRIDARCAKIRLIQEARKLEEMPIPKLDSLESVRADSPEIEDQVRSSELGENREEEVRWGAAGS